jgi:valyl-tRNA synthetase
LDNVLRLLHPVMPFVTEEIWQKLPGAGETIMLAPWPTANQTAIDQAAEKEATFIIELVNAIRQTKHESGISSKQEIEVTLFHDKPETLSFVVRNDNEILQLAKVSVGGMGSKPVSDKEAWLANVEHGRAVKFAIPGVEGFLELGEDQDVDISGQVERLSNRLAGINADLDKLKVKLANEQFVSKAAPEAVAKVRNKAAELEEMEEKLRHQLELLGG